MGVLHVGQVSRLGAKVVSSGGQQLILGDHDEQLGRKRVLGNSAHCIGSACSVGVGRTEGRMTGNVARMTRNPVGPDCVSLLFEFVSPKLA